MHSIRVHNINLALREVLWRIRTSGVEENSRNGPVLRLHEPLCVTYTSPSERVLFWGKRDANPFFHFMEALWMLGGRNDVAFPARFTSQIAKYSDDGVTFDGAYGHRWRHHFEFDQLWDVIQLLRHHPDTRRAVIGMWDPTADLHTNEDVKDIPCNTTVMFQRRGKALDMMVTNRSNDVIWGMCGANAVHMSMLHEYVARGAWMELGVYHQVTMNAHMYLNDQGGSLLEFPECDNRYHIGAPIVEVPAELEMFDNDLHMFLDDPTGDVSYQTPYFQDLVAPMMDAWTAHKNGDHDGARACVAAMPMCDWRVACSEWLERRYDNR